jgi:hypothetical protein
MSVFMYEYFFFKTEKFAKKVEKFTYIFTESNPKKKWDYLSQPPDSTKSKDSPTPKLCQLCREISSNPQRNSSQVLVTIFFQVFYSRQTYISPKVYKDMKAASPSNSRVNRRYEL